VLTCIATPLMSHNEGPAREKEVGFQDGTPLKS